MVTATNASQTKIHLTGIRKDFSVRKRVVSALSDINLDIQQGEFVCIVGPSGCGKTTLLRILAGLETQTSGSFLVTPDDGPNARGRPRPINSMVFQEQSILPWMTVRDNVAFGLKAQGLGKRDRYAIANPFIRTVGLTGFEDALPHQLSGGMKQRVSLARAFANDPQILLMDEPFAALDEQTKLVLQAELLRIWEGTHKTVVYVTHSIDEAIVLADRLIIMSARPGRIKEIIDVDRYFGRPRKVEQVKTSAHYGELFGRVWTQLRPEVQAEQVKEA
jgi:NitT/TauT family transport system ATP-binding protein